MRRTNKSSGFTLIELIVVIAIIGLLAGVVLASLSDARKQARDRERQTDLKQMELALELYKEAYGQYPTPDSSCHNGMQWHGWAADGGQPWYEYCNKGAGQDYIGGLTPTFIPALPEDEKFDTDSRGYIYRTNGTDYKLLSRASVESLTIGSDTEDFARYPASAGCSGTSPSHSYAVYSKGAACW